MNFADPFERVKCHVCHFNELSYDCLKKSVSYYLCKILRLLINYSTLLVSLQAPS